MFLLLDLTHDWLGASDTKDGDAERGRDAISDWGTQLSGREVFRLWDTFGFPVEMTQEIARESGIEVDLDGFEREMASQRQRGRASARFGGDRAKIRVYESLRPRWSESVVKMTKMMGDVLNNDEFSDFDAESKSAALTEINSALEDHISWERMGADVVRKSLLQSCGADLLKAVVPYFSDRNLASKMPDELVEKLDSCWIDVDLRVSTAPAYATMEFSKTHMLQILARHGIDPNRK